MSLEVVKSKLNTFFCLENRIRWMCVEIIFLSGIVRIAIKYIPFKYLKKYMGKHNEESGLHVKEDEYEIIKDIKWCIDLICYRTPWESKCLVQAITAQRLLYKRGIMSTLYLGVKKNEKNEMLAHAWLRSGELFVTGGFYKDEYCQVSKFAKI